MVTGWMVEYFDIHFVHAICFAYMYEINIYKHLAFCMQVVFYGAKQYFVKHVETAEKYMLHVFLMVLG